MPLSTIKKRFEDARERYSEGPAAEWVAKIRPYLPPINFVTLHYAYFIFSCLIFAAIFQACGSSTTPEIGYLDSLFVTMSALTATGMNTVNLSEMSLGQQIILFLSLMLGHPILISLWTVLFRRHVFEKRFRAIVKAERARKLKAGSTIWLYSGFSDLLALARMRSMGKTESKDDSTKKLPGLGTRIPPGQPSESGAQGPEKDGEEHDVEAGLAPAPKSGVPNLPGAKGIAFLEPPPRVNGNAKKPTIPSEEDRTAEVRNFLQEKRKNVGRNGEFFNLTLKEREYLGGVEYRAVEVLVVTVAMYYVLWQLLGAIALGTWLAVNEPEIATTNGQNPWWTGIFLAISAFASGGMSLLDAGMTAFQSGYYFVLIVSTLLILAGNQASPIFLRFIIWVLSRTLRFSTKNENHAVWKETFDFILQYPRRVYINMFPSRPTMMLTLSIGGFLFLDWIMFFVLNIGNPTIESIPPGPRVMDGLFQSTSILSAGFAVVSISGVYYGLQVLWLIKMYASAYPTSITVRGSNVYEERSLGIYAGDDPEDSDDKGDGKNEKNAPAAGGLFLNPGTTTGMQPPMTPMSATSNASRLSRLSQASRGGIDKIVNLGREGGAKLGRQLQRRMTEFQGVGVAAPMRRHKTNFSLPQLNQPTPQSSASSSTASVGSADDFDPPKQDLVSHHVRSQLSHDVWWIALAFFLITIIETSHTLGDPAAYSLFNILFEIVSAYANNGVSMGLPNAAHSFSGGWHPGSRFVLVLVMLRGRHRDLPVALDRAVKLPSMDLDEKEEDDAEIRRTITRTPNLVQSPPLHSPGRIRPFSPM
ncbi:cation transport protein-domain-containing protein [Chaetomium fimeti]|uniref:Cation transport protein-domain-containing protein n=1 Tax=Chaetomium fimeti TaxID=1854472 RepID=A0AAE0HET7_9PEZI|nr:cation transport protein-domain-containing protein [Chaetomium fimeti]